MPTVINGLPVHVLLVHVVVVFVPLAALLLLASALWPAARRRLGVITPIVALIAVVAIPPTAEAGEWLIKRVDKTSLVRNHAHLADGLLPWALGMLIVAVAIWALYEKAHWFTRRTRPVVQSDRALVASSVGGSPTAEQAAATTAAGTTAATTTASDDQNRPRDTPAWLTVTRIVAVVLAVVVSVGSVVEVYLVGDSGAKAAWTGGFSAAPAAPTLPATHN
ncbi:MAG TPA: hypothetical protein VF444_25105 [Pseudonocardiaceae bacterium]